MPIKHSPPLLFNEINFPVMYNLSYKAIFVCLQLCFIRYILKIEQQNYILDNFTSEMMLSITLKSVISKLLP